jgi:hypothetical protein
MSNLISGLSKFQKKENEAFFNNVLSTTKEGGIFFWISMQEALTRKDNKFQCSEAVLKEAKLIVSEEFFEAHFELKQD